MFTWPTIVKKPKGKNILILAPHMDDEIIGCGGVICKHIQNGDRVTVGPMSILWTQKVEHFLSA